MTMVVPVTAICMFPMVVGEVAELMLLSVGEGKRDEVIFFTRICPTCGV
jgi:hypothetical protein